MNGLEPLFYDWSGTTGRQKGIPKGVDKTHLCNANLFVLSKVLDSITVLVTEKFFTRNPSNWYCLKYCRI